MGTYRVHGLCVHSSLDLPELPGIGLEAPNRADFDVVEGTIPRSIAHYAETDEGFLVADGAVLVEPEDGIRFLVERGRRITVECTGASPEVVRLFLYGAAFSVLLQQRGLMPLHASACVTSNGAVAFAGPTQHGKSTMAATLSGLGYPILSDDKIVIHPGAQSEFLVSPGPPSLSLFEEAAAMSGQSRQARVSDYLKFGKHTYHVPDLYADQPVRLAALCFLRWSTDGKISTERLAPFQAVIELRRNLNSPSLVSVLEFENRFLSWAEALLAWVPAFLVARPHEPEALRQTAETILEQISMPHG